MKITNLKSLKIISDENYHHVFDMEGGKSFRWGKTKDEDPDFAPAPELLDIEISTVIPESEAQKFLDNPNYNVQKGGCNGVGCFFCYKGNNKGNYTVSMSFGAYKELFAKIPKTVCQIAFGITSIHGNPDMWKIFEYTRENGIIPNVTVNGMDLYEEDYLNIKKYCGAVAVSVNEQNAAFSLACVGDLLEYGVEQVNIHYVIHEASYEYVFELMDHLKKSPIFEKFGALVLLTAKDKQHCGMKPVTVDQYRNIIRYAAKKYIRLGFDSCGAHLYRKCIEGTREEKIQDKYIECCESGLFSFYINTHREGFICSFAEDIHYKWDMMNCEDFLKDIWNSELMNQWRKVLLEGNRHCPFYQIG